jgi:hypothetical protein
MALHAAGAQQSPARPVTPPTGCWQLKPGPFSIIRRFPAEPGQTVLPLVISFDTTPGRSWDNRPIGRRVRTLSDTIATQYHEGYYRIVAPDSVLVDWSDSVVGMTLELRLDSIAMRGRATAWTDYGGGQRATITLRRVTCPRAG